MTSQSLNKILCSILIAAASVWGCEKVIDNKEAGGTKDNVLIVEGMITDQYGPHSVRLSTIQPLYSEADPTPVSDAVVRISDGVNTYSLAESGDAGLYQTDSLVKGTVGKTYTLTVISGGKEYVATDKIFDVTPLSPLTYQESERPGIYKWDVPKDHTLAEGITYEWHATFVRPNSAERTEVIYYNFTSLEMSALFSLNEATQTILFPPGTIITQEKYSLSPGYYKFLKGVYTEVDWKGDMYDVVTANPVGNVSNGALGYFRASAVSSHVELVE